MDCLAIDETTSPEHSIRNPLVRDALAFAFLLLYPERGLCGTVNFLAEKTGGHTVWLENYSDGRTWGEGCAPSPLFNFLARISAATSSVLPNTTL
jgi:hypothetical protein